MTYHDEEVIGLDGDGCVVQWDAELAAPYNSGLSPEAFGVEAMSHVERARISPTASHL